MTEKDKFINDTSETFKISDSSFRIVKTENGFAISKMKNNLSELLILILILLIIPIGLVFYDSDKTTIIIALIWEMIFVYRFYRVKIADNVLEFDSKEKRLEVRNISPIFKHFISPKNFELDTIKDFELNRVRHTRYGLASIRLIALFENSEKQILNDFDSINGAKRIKFMIEKLTDKTAGNTS